MSIIESAKHLTGKGEAPEGVTPYQPKKAKKKKDCKSVEKIAAMKMAEYDIDYLLQHKADYNPRTISGENKAGLSLCLNKFGYVQPIVFNVRTERIVSGHQRIDLLSEQGYKKAQVSVVDLPENLEKELNIALNSGTITGEFTAEVNDLIQDILDNDAEFFDMLNLNSILMDEEGEEEPEETPKKSNTEGVPGMELLPYEHYDCLLVVFKHVDDFLYLSSELKLDERRIISSPNVKNKKIGKLRAIPADKLIELIRKKKTGTTRDILSDPDLDFEL